jgi:hypothetical protein
LGRDNDRKTPASLLDPGFAFGRKMSFKKAKGGGKPFNIPLRAVPSRALKTISTTDITTEIQRTTFTTKIRKSDFWGLKKGAGIRRFFGLRTARAVAF